MKSWVCTVLYLLIDLQISDDGKLSVRQRNATQKTVEEWACYLFLFLWYMTYESRSSENLPNTVPYSDSWQLSNQMNLDTLCTAPTSGVSRGAQLGVFAPHSPIVHSLLPPMFTRYNVTGTLRYGTFSARLQALEVLPRCSNLANLRRRKNRQLGTDTHPWLCRVCQNSGYKT